MSESSRADLPLEIYVRVHRAGHIPFFSRAGCEKRETSVVTPHHRKGRSDMGHTALHVKDSGLKHLLVARAFADRAH